MAFHVLQLVYAVQIDVSKSYVFDSFLFVMLYMDRQCIEIPVLFHTHISCDYGERLAICTFFHNVYSNAIRYQETMRNRDLKNSNMLVDIHKYLTVIRRLCNSTFSYIYSVSIKPKCFQFKF